MQFSWLLSHLYEGVVAKRRSAGSQPAHALLHGHPGATALARGFDAARMLHAPAPSHKGVVSRSHRDELKDFAGAPPKNRFNSGGGAGEARFGSPVLRLRVSPEREPALTRPVLEVMRGGQPPVRCV